jgi:hypothetical protein
VTGAKKFVIPSEFYVAKAPKKCGQHTVGDVTHIPSSHNSKYQLGIFNFE